MTYLLIACLLARVLPCIFFSPVKDADFTLTKQHLSNVIVMKQHHKLPIYIFYIILYQSVVMWQWMINNYFIITCHEKINTQVNWASEGCVSSEKCCLQRDGFHCYFSWFSGKTASQLQRWVFNNPPAVTTCCQCNTPFIEQSVLH